MKPANAVVIGGYTQPVGDTPSRDDETHSLRLANCSSQLATHKKQLFQITTKQTT